jgi:ornithine cyclodeaminase/alanine dehydrogenase-like protein (mu-crystallin family)
METEGTLVVKRSDVQQLLSLTECIDAVERVFRWQGEGKIPPSGILGARTQNGGLHVKTAFLSGAKSYIAAKLNSNFPQNNARFGLPTIQGVIVLYDADNGRLLAVLDSMEITIKRTAAATAVAAKYLARKDSSVATICGCGEQGRAQLRALSLVLPLRHTYAFDVDSNASLRFAAELSRVLQIEIEPASGLLDAIQGSDVIVTCTPATEFFVHKEDVDAATFIAAVGADDSHKQEIDPALIASAKVVADSLEQICSIGDTHHAIAKGLMQKESVHAELAEVVAGKKAGRTSDAEIIVFDSTGVAIEDAAAATLVYEKALTARLGNYFAFAA